MALIKPQIHLSKSNGSTEYLHYKTYHKDLLPKIGGLLKKADVNTLTVYRSRRGQWGEWFEEWELINNVPKIIRKGWS
jgi:hypothetical protein